MGVNASNFFNDLFVQLIERPNMKTSQFHIADFQARQNM